ncbi:restriction endonuclease subunit S [Capnocytophaga canimorsus]|uniref:restriction endonuclease subunit S n=1 Tax=Capnocytophaga canimorsus TaxID=28188 RepID=UPI0037D13737
MNYIKNLLKDQKVEWKTLGEVCEIRTGQGINKRMILDNAGEHPVINSGREPLGFINKWNTEDDPIGITSRGAGVGSITWQEGKYFRGNLNYSVTHDKNEINTRFLYHLLLEFQREIQSLCTFDGIPALNTSNLKSLQIPIPPLAVQKEIAKILDTFTMLEAELEAELDCRKRQYQYYRDTLLTFGDNVEWKTLGEVCKIKGRIGFRGYTQKDFVEKGEGAISLSPGNMKNGYFDFEKCSYISWEKYEESPEIKISEKDIIFVKTGSTAGKVDVHFLPEKSTLNPQLVVLKDVECNKRFLFHLLNTNRYQAIIKTLINGAIPNISQKELSKLQIPLPPLEEQKRIVNILDKFDALVNDISQGLPAEINARRKQYEYYREKLLSFPEN